MSIDTTNEIQIRTAHTGIRCVADKFRFFSLIECLHSTPKYDIMLIITKRAVCARRSVSYTDRHKPLQLHKNNRITNDLCIGSSSQYM